ncbi:unnamed protein product, partial [Mesorhabditis spiculigera]
MGYGTQVQEDTTSLIATYLEIQKIMAQYVDARWRTHYQSERRLDDLAREKQRHAHNVNVLTAHSGGARMSLEMNETVPKVHLRPPARDPRLPEAIATQELVGVDAGLSGACNDTTVDRAYINDVHATTAIRNATTRFLQLVEKISKTAESQKSAVEQAKTSCAKREKAFKEQRDKLAIQFPEEWFKSLPLKQRLGQDVQGPQPNPPQRGRPAEYVENSQCCNCEKTQKLTRAYGPVACPDCRASYRHAIEKLLNGETKPCSEDPCSKDETTRHGPPDLFNLKAPYRRPLTLNAAFFQCVAASILSQTSKPRDSDETSCPPSDPNNSVRSLQLLPSRLQHHSPVVFEGRR